MAKKKKGKFLNNMLGLHEEEYDEYDEFEEDEEFEDNEERIKPIRTHKINNVVDIQSAGASISSSSPRVFISKPADFEEATVIVDNLKSKKIVVVNTNSIDCNVGQRLLDFISGASYALSAELQQIDKGVYLLSPSNVEVNSSLKNELSSKGMFSFIK
ncbi:cell division protein SepF [Oceanirhabdus seepicola]|uniref:Cell division protein SepF n=1 Tax=Oceanirhabdus seepicola TaxID=2828781 RepID=A0A9J6PCT5_9CLOT|nr:cell division protein SepF [Oceanirhabdus seepicola]MCM1992717.1 cell division protein SepF [Oceanirhabdus seepicola]